MLPNAVGPASILWSTSPNSMVPIIVCRCLVWLRLLPGRLQCRCMQVSVLLFRMAMVFPVYAYLLIPEVMWPRMAMLFSRAARLANFLKLTPVVRLTWMLMSDLSA